MTDSQSGGDEAIPHGLATLVRAFGFWLFLSAFGAFSAFMTVSNPVKFSKVWIAAMAAVVSILAVLDILVNGGLPEGENGI